MKPILFNTGMVKAILEGRKTCTRRLCNINVNHGWKVKHEDCGSVEYPRKNYQGLCAEFYRTEADHGSLFTVYCGAAKPQYQVGDILYVRETIGYGYYAAWDHQTFYRADYDDKPDFVAKWIPSIHMPKEDARIFLRVTDVRVEHLQDIDYEGCKAEGIWDDYKTISQTYHDNLARRAYPVFFGQLWDSTVKKADLPKYGWNANPWVWVYSFERIEKPCEE